MGDRDDSIWRLPAVSPHSIGGWERTWSRPRLPVDIDNFTDYRPCSSTKLSVPGTTRNA